MLIKSMAPLTLLARNIWRPISAAELEKKLNVFPRPVPFLMESPLVSGMQQPNREIF